MADPILSTIEKALAVNLDPLKYGTMVEIGAGQEVARWFFQAGGAAGTVAKTMSAYDMKFSDEIYGVASDRRYVSKARLERMLEREFALVVSRVEDVRPQGSRFFAFADTVVARGFLRSGECHGWIGIRLQLAPKAPPDDILLHVRMLDDTNVEQQEALGMLGVNLIHGAFTHMDAPATLLRRLMDNLKPERVEIDFVEFRGPTLGATVDNRLMALELVKASLTRAILFDRSGRNVVPADALHHKAVLAMRGSFRPVQVVDTEILDDAMARFRAQHDVTSKGVLPLAEITMARNGYAAEADTADFLVRVEGLAAEGFHTLVSEYRHRSRIRQYLARYTDAPVGMVMDAADIAEIFQESLYDDADGGLLAGLGRLFPNNTAAYVYPSVRAGQVATLDTIAIAPHLRPLLAYLRERRLIVPAELPETLLN